MTAAVGWCEATSRSSSGPRTGPSSGPGRRPRPLPEAPSPPSAPAAAPCSTLTWPEPASIRKAPVNSGAHDLGAGLYCPAARARAAEAEAFQPVMTRSIATASDVAGPGGRACVKKWVVTDGLGRADSATLTRCLPRSGPSRAPGRRWQVSTLGGCLPPLPKPDPGLRCPSGT